MPYVLIEAHPTKSQIVEVGDWPVIKAYLHGRYPKKREYTDFNLDEYLCLTLHTGEARWHRITYGVDWYQIEYHRGKHVKCGPCEWPKD